MKNLLLIISIITLLSSNVEAGDRSYTSLSDPIVKKIDSKFSHKNRSEYKSFETKKTARITSNDEDYDSQYAIIEFDPNDIIAIPATDIFKEENTEKFSENISEVAYIPQDYEGYEETGVASWYGDDFSGRPTANGEIYDMNIMSAAHRTLPLPSLVLITNLANNKSMIVRVNDRGPYAKNRIIDVSKEAAQALEFKDFGTARVKIELLKNDTDKLLKRIQN